MNRDDVPWRGYWTAVTTTFGPSGAFEESGWRQLLRWMVQQGMHGLVIAGSTGEWFSLSAGERHRLFHVAAHEVGGEVPLLGGCSAFTPGEAIAHARAAAAAGLDGILLTPPPYVVPSDDETVEFFTAVHAAVPLPIVVYNWPTGTGVDLDVAVLRRLARLERVVGVKNSTPSLDRFVESVVALRDELRIFGLVPSEHTIGMLRHVGGDGVIGAGGVLGAHHPRFYEAVWEADLTTARTLAAIEQRIMRDWLAPGYRGRFGHATSTFKAALDARGLPGGHPRPPLLPLGPPGLEAVSRTLRELGLVPA